MTSYKRLAFSVVAVLLLSLPMLAQYSSTRARTGADIINSASSPSGTSYNCVSNNCWAALGSATFTSLSASPNGNIQAIGTNGYRYHWNVSTQVWDEQSDGVLGGNFKAIRGADPYFMALTTATSANAYYWSGSAWVQFPGTGACADAAVSSTGSYYCIGVGGAAGDVYKWNGTGWNPIRTLGDAATITSSVLGAAIIDTSHNVWIWNSDTSAWTEAPYTGFSPSTAIGSIGLGNDNSVSIVGSSGNVQISHDAGVTWSSVDHSGITPDAVANSDRANSFMLDTSGQVHHLNTIVPRSVYTLTGSCGSACNNIGNAPVYAMYHNDQPELSQFVCPTGWSIWTGGSNYCFLSTTANTVLNATASSFMSNCDFFVSTTGCSDTNTGMQVQVIASGLFLYSELTQCNCDLLHEGFVNQKYFVNNKYNTQPEPVAGLIGDTLGLWRWSGVNLTQWCTAPYAPNIGGGVGPWPLGADVDYFFVYTQPTAMPGRYINGDVLTIQFGDGSVFGPTMVLGIPVIVNFHHLGSGLPGSIYTWDGTSAKRGPGGNPTTVCGGTQSL
jgi:hypothetical protein